MDLSRRDFMLAGTTSVLAMPSDVRQQVQPQLQSDSVNAEGFAGVADLLGPEAARPEPGDPFFEDKTFNGYRYEETDTGDRWFITEPYAEWTPLMTNPETQVDEVRVREFNAFLDHTFARPEAPDDKNWVYTDADVTKQNSEIELAATTLLESTQEGNYSPGTDAVPGVAGRVTGTPTGGRADMGYFNDNNGFGAGEDATDSYAIIRKGGTETQVYRTNWNGYIPDGRVWTNESPVITRFPHLFYGGGSIEIRALLHEDGESRLRTLHTFTPDNTPGSGPPTDQPNLPIRFESDSLAGGNLRANAAHYEIGHSQSETRVNGEHLSVADVGTTGWTPLVAWRKRSGWDMVNVKPLKIEIASTSDMKLAVQLDPTLSGGTWTRPENTGSDETAVEINLGATLDAVGERRWVGSVSGGGGNKTANARSNDLTFNLPAGQDVVLVAQAFSSTGDVSGNVAWEEFF